MSSVKKLIALLLIGLLTGIALISYMNRMLTSPMPISPEGTVFILKPGDTLSSVSSWLYQEGYFSQPELIKLYSRLSKKGAVIKAGEYVLTPNMSVIDFLDKLTEGDVVQYSVTFVEGRTVKEIITLLHSLPKITHTDDLSADNVLEKIGVDSIYSSSEGLFFPDTYSYYSGMSDVSILKTAHRKMRNTLAEQWNNRNKALSLPFKSDYEVLIMASLIEKETGDPSEREQISGVFFRRLLKNMRLQTDPTVIYGLGESFDGNLTRRHLRDSSNLYNTYRHSGLPPGPIALPGSASISAALNPAPGDTLYFVAKGDGTHVFSTTLEEHERAVKQYQIIARKKNYRSSPPQSKTL